MNNQSFTAQVLAIEDENARQAFLNEMRDSLSSEIIVNLEDLVNSQRLENPQEALRTIRVIEQIAVVLNDERIHANALRLEGNIHIHLGNYEKSVHCYAEAKRIRARFGETLEIARLQVGWTAALKNMARYEDALQLAEDTRAILIEHHKWDWLANLEMNIGSIYRLVERYEEAIDAYGKSHEHFLLAGNPIGAAQSQVNTARALGSQDRFHEALDLLNQVRTIFEMHEKWQPLARADLNIAILFSRLGRYQDAWECFDKAWDGFKKQDNEVEMAVVDLYRSQVYLSLNLFPEVLEFTQAAHSVFVQQHMARHVALADFMQAVAYSGLGEHEQALQILESTRAAIETYVGVTWVALVDLERAVLLRQLNQPAEALPIIEAAATTFDHFEMRVRLAQAQLQAAECHLDLGQEDQAMALYQKTLTTPADQRLATLDFRAHYGLGRIAETRHEWDKARQEYQTAIKEVDSIRSGLRVDEFKASFLDDKLSLYQDAVRLSLLAGDLEQAFELVERSKSSALLDLLAHEVSLQTPTGEEADSDLWQRFQELKEKWRWQYSKLEYPPIENSEDHIRAGTSHDDRLRTRNTQAWQELKRLETSLQHLARQLQGHGPAPLVDKMQQSALTVTHFLKKDAILIEYFCIDDELLAFLLWDGEIRVCRDFVCSLREIKRSLEVLNLALKNVSGLDPVYIQDILTPLAQRHLAWLHEALIAPLGPFIDGFRKLVLVPHDILYYLPFHAFFDGNTYLIENFEVQYTPSAGVLAQCYRTKQNAKTYAEPRPALVMGYSDNGRLQHVADEVQAVASALPNPLLFQEEDATLNQLHQQAGQCGLVHLASHAVFRSDNPLFSSIKLADGPLNVIDIYRLRLHATLVTLSACETGVSQLKGGDLFGLMRGCLYAGASSLVVSLWQVDDTSTSRLMGEFYRRLDSGESIASALRSAQLVLCQSGQNQEGEIDQIHGHPHYWAPFFFVGADGYLV